MKRLTLFVAVIALTVAGLAYAQAKPDFSGTWTLDASKSDQMGGPGGGGGRGPGMGGPMTIKQTEAELQITRGPMTQTYKLDGSESVNAMGQMQAKSVAKVDGDKLVVKTTRETPGGPMETTATYSLGADGKELTVVTSTPRGERKMVYTRQ